MKMGLGFYPSTYSEDALSFAKQIGVSHIMIHIPSAEMLPSAREGYWSAEDLQALVRQVEGHGLKLEAIENLSPPLGAHPHGRPKREEQMDNVKRTIENLGKAGIPIMGYNFSLAAVAGRKMLPYARGGAISPVYDKDADENFDKPLPNGFVWGQQVEEAEGDMGDVSLEEMWDRYDWFMDRILPVAEAAGVKMAIHPDDPPVPVMRHVNRLMVSVDRYDENFGGIPRPTTWWSSARARSRRCPTATTTSTTPSTTSPRCRRSPTSTSATCAASSRATTRSSSTAATWT